MTSEDRAFLVRRLIVGGVVLLGVIAVLLGARRLGVDMPLWLPIIAGLMINDIMQPIPPGRFLWSRRERVRFALVSGLVCSLLFWGFTAWLG